MKDGLNSNEFAIPGCGDRVIECLHCLKACPREIDAAILPNEIELPESSPDYYDDWHEMLNVLQIEHYFGSTGRLKVCLKYDEIIVFGLCLAYQAGFRAQELFSSGWIHLLDCQPTMAREFAVEAKRLGLIDLRSFGDAFNM